MKFLILVITISQFLMFSALAQEFSYGDIYEADDIEKLLNTTSINFKEPNCIANYKKTADYISRIRAGAKIRFINVCSQGSNIRFNIRFDQMGGRQGSVGSINTIIDCYLKNPVRSEGCESY